MICSGEDVEKGQDLEIDIRNPVCGLDAISQFSSHWKVGHIVEEVLQRWTQEIISGVSSFPSRYRQEYVDACLNIVASKWKEAAMFWE